MRRPRSSGGPLGDGQRNLLCLAGSTQPDRDRLADAVGSEGVHNRLDMPDRLAVPVDDDVALEMPAVAPGPRGSTFITMAPDPPPSIATSRRPRPR